MVMYFDYVKQIGELLVHLKDTLVQANWSKLIISLLIMAGILVGIGALVIGNVAIFLKWLPTLLMTMVFITAPIMYLALNKNIVNT